MKNLNASRSPPGKMKSQRLKVKGQKSKVKLILKNKTMNSFSAEMSKRFIEFVINIIKLDKQLCKSYSGRHIYGQLFRAGTSAGANFEESRAGESRADFIHKMQIVLKELRESHYWIRLIIAGNLNSSEHEALKFLYQESLELTGIIGKSIFTAKTKNVKGTKGPDHTEL